MSRAVVFLLLVAIAYIGLSTVEADCGPNEIWKQCSSKCEPTCRNPMSMCIEECGEPMCQCNPNYVRNSQNECVLYSRC
ncbi:chymotrypsin inhibitor-like [Hylaeus anthracinus]|uniref:chymotrypsin inhibitor-like n=1 Tax=Hylaeus anthracinus TaxID=313031 RepID=UPI0023B98D2F|nr:chymotrypsin inhibitor-like [Hylaeus anthracinus]